MITYKEFEVLRGIMKGYGNCADVAQRVYDNTHYRVFKDAEEVNELYLSLINKGYVNKEGVTPVNHQFNVMPCKT